GFRGGSAPWHAQTSPGYVHWDCVTLADLVDQAWSDQDHPLLNETDRPRPQRFQPSRVKGGPPWAATETFTVEARAPLAVTRAGLAEDASRNLARLPQAMAQALRAVLEDRFEVKVSRATEERPMYALRVAKSGLNKKNVTTPAAGDCLTLDEYS